MKTLLLITGLTFVKLRRDRIFLPAIIFGILFVALAMVVSIWGVEEFRKLLMDFGSFGFYLVGTVVAIFWGTKVVSDARKDGSIELVLAGPVSRWQWLWGNFFGLALGLLGLGMVLLVAWQGLLAAFGYGTLSLQEWVAFGFLIVSWLVVAALAVFFGALASSAVALFCSVTMWVVGLAAVPVVQTLSPETPAMTRKVVEGIAMIWNLKQFSFIETLWAGNFPTSYDLYLRLAYAALAIVFLLSLGGLVFQRRDISA